MPSTAPTPDRYIVRRLHTDDYDRGYLQTLEELTTVGPISKADFVRRMGEMPLEQYRHFVVVDTIDRRIVGAGTLLVELKFIHTCGSVGHVEDVVVAERCRGKQLGKVIVEALVAEAKRAGCYKIILDCADKNVQFYERCGFTKKELQMVIYL